ncbi:MAG: EVE domain-containing protein [Bryobacteraceae bacterium]|nr:EVE domain-containing protein [Bryobacteraceae bacterium]
MASYFLAKTEPGVYSIDDLKQEGKTVWNGVRNAQALSAIRTMKPRDRVFIYHSGGVSAIVGVAEVVSESRPDPDDQKLVVVDLRYVSHLDPPTTLAEVKASGQFADWSLVRQSRLSTMQAPDKFVTWMREKHPKAKI